MSKQGWREIRRIIEREKGGAMEDPGSVFIRGTLRLLAVMAASLAVTLILVTWGPL